MDQTTWKKYSETYGARFSAGQKTRFRKAIKEDFEALGYSCEIVQGKRLLTRANNMVFGSLKRAKSVVAIPYDTPQKVFWPKSYFYPLDGMATNNKSLIPSFAPVLIIYVILLAFMYGVDGFIQGGVVVQISLTIILLLILLMFYLMLHGMTNRKNYNRNSASIYAAYEIAKNLTQEARRNTAFVFVDCNKSKHLGAKVAAEDFLKQSKNPNLIVLNTFANGSQMQIGFNPQNKKLAQDINKALSNSERLKTVALTSEMRTSSPMEHFAKAVSIGAGEMDNKGRLCVMGTGKSKDQVIMEENIDKVISMMTAYLS